MAGEIRGKCVEALTIVALKAAFGSRFKLDAWDEPVPPLLWKPDILGTLAGINIHVLVTYSGSETHSKEKFWRNIAECLDAKMRQPKKVLVISIVYKARMRRKLAKATALLLDGYIEQTSKKVSTIPALFLKSVSGATRDQKIVMARSMYWDQMAADLQNSLLRSLQQAIKKANPASAASMFTLLSKHRRNGVSLPPRNLSIHEGVVKGALLSEADLNGIAHSAKNIAPSNSHLSLYKMAGVCHGVAHRISPIILETMQRLGTDAYLDIVTNGITPTGLSARSILHQLPALEAQFAYLQNNILRLQNARNLKKTLTACFHDPALMLKDLCPDYVSSGCWLFTLIKNSLAAAFGRQGQEWIEAVSVRSGEMRSILVGLHFPKLERGEELPPERVLIAIADVFAEKLHSITSGLQTLKAAAINEIIATNLSNRLSAHGYQTGWYLLKRYLETKGKVFSEGLQTSAVSEYCGLDKKTGSTRFLKTGRTLIHCKLLTEDGRDHKVKELFSRSAFTKIAFGNNQRWSLRDNIDKMILVLDGSVRSQDIKILGSAWWDHIVYADNLRDLDALLN